MRSPEDMAANLPRRPRRRRQYFFAALAIIILLALSLFRGAAIFYTDFLWFQSVHLTSVWSGILTTKILLAAVGCVFLFVLLWVNIWIADHWAPRALSLDQEDEFVKHYKAFVSHRQNLVRTTVSFVLALFGGIGFYSHWNQWLLFLNGGKFGIKDPQFHKDISFFVFKLPFLNALVDSVMVALIVALIVSAAAHYAQGAIPIGKPRVRITSAVKAHFSILAGLLALLQAVKYYLDRYELSYSTRGVTTGANYTDVHFMLPALILLSLISILAAVVFFAGMRRRGWSIPAITVGLWALISVLIGAVIPAGVQKFVVEPAESQKELPYIQRNIDATRDAFNLQNVQVHDFNYTNTLTSGDLNDNAQTIRNVRLWDPLTLLPSYQRLQATRSFFAFDPVDEDRYQLNGEETQMMLSVRELNTQQLPAGRRSWVGEHLQYTHGYGAVTSPANAVTSDGSPDFTLKDTPPTGTPELTLPQVYFGNFRSSDDYSIVGTGQPEVDYVGPDGQDQTSVYHGSGGVVLSNILRRAAFATRVGDINPLISSLVNSHAKALFETNISDRAAKVAPFLKFDSDPYPVILNGRIEWVQDAYTTTNAYPYSTTYGTTPNQINLLPNGSQLNGTQFNYIRNSVKVVTDAYNGNITFYVTDPTDPIIKAWEKAFPKLFTDGSKIPADLRAHLRFPEDLYRVQTSDYGQYHMTKAVDFYRGSDRWNIAQNPSNSPGAQQTSGTVIDQNGRPVNVNEPRVQPYYLLMRLPGEQQAQFIQFEPFVPYSTDDSRKELSAFMTASNDPGSYGQLNAYVMPRDQQVNGPALVDARIQQEPKISQQISLLNQQGSRVSFGDLLIIPINNSLLYVRPMYVTAQQTQVPQFKNAIVVQGDKVAMEPTLQQALSDVFGSAPSTLEQQPAPASVGNPAAPTPSPTTPAPSGANSAQVQQLLSQANQDFTNANNALKAGDLGGYQQNVAAGMALVQQAQQLAGQ